MKRTLITVILIISICVSLKAQIYLGAKGGVAVANFSNMKKETKPSTGYKVGLSFQYMFTDFGVESGAYIKQVGINDSKGILSGKNSDFIPVSMEVQPKYFELPISLVYKYKLAGNLKLCINGGGYLSYGYGGGGIISYSTGFLDWVGLSSKANINENKIIFSQKSYCKTSD